MVFQAVGACTGPRSSTPWASIHSHLLAHTSSEFLASHIEAAPWAWIAMVWDRALELVVQAEPLEGKAKAPRI
jgi:uncharacterized protein YfiM (DUF2279 family)